MKTTVRSELDDFKEETNEMLSKWKFSDTTPIQNRFQELENQLKDALERENERKRDAEREKMLEKQRMEDLLDIDKSIGGYQNDGTFYDPSQSHEWNTQRPSLAMKWSI